MNTRTRMLGLKEWLYETLCEGRSMKTPSQDMDIAKIVRTEPQVYCGWFPRRPEQVSGFDDDPPTVCPSILIMPNSGNIKLMEEKRFDRYNSVRRPSDLGQTLNVSMLFSVYEPGVRRSGFKADPSKMNLIEEGTEEGLFTLTDWMDECIRNMLGQQLIPNTDLFLNEQNCNYGLYQDQSYVVDKRPIFYGFVNAEFGCYADDGINDEITQRLL